MSHLHLLRSTGGAAPLLAAGGWRRAQRGHRIREPVQQLGQPGQAPDARAGALVNPRDETVTSTGGIVNRNGPNGAAPNRGLITSLVESNSVAVANGAIGGSGVSANPLAPLSAFANGSPGTASVLQPITGLVSTATCALGTATSETVETCNSEAHVSQYESIKTWTTRDPTSKTVTKAARTRRLRQQTHAGAHLSNGFGASHDETCSPRVNATFSYQLN